MAITTDQAFQWIFDNAETIAMNRRSVVAQTVSRDGTTRSTSRGGNVWRFTIKMPDGFRYSAIRDYLAALDYADRLYPGNVSLDNTGSLWLAEYQGGATGAEIANITANQSSSSMTTLTIGNLTTISNGVTVLAQGDFLQLKSGGTPRASVYTVVNDVVKSGSTATVSLNRPLLNWNGNVSTSYGIQVGNDVQWTLLCGKMPGWTVTANQLVVWNDTFEFIEDLYAGRTGNI